MEGFLKAFDPNQNGVAKAFDPKQNGVEDWANNTFSNRSINQQNTILKGVFSTNKDDKEAGKIAMMAPANGALSSGIYDHPTNKPNNYDAVYNPNPKAPNAPKIGNSSSNSNSVFYLVGGALVVLVILYNNRR